LKLAHILCPTDFSEASTHALEQATVLAGWYRAKITVLCVHTPALLTVPIPFGTGRPAGGEHSAEIKRLQGITASFAAPALKAGLGVETRVEMGLPATQIVADASALGADMIVMGTHGTSGFQHLVLGSVTEKVLRRAECPVLTVPPRTHSTSRLPLTHILCPIDFSDSSFSALAWAWSLARESRATVSLLHVIEWPWEEPPPPHLEELPAKEAGMLADFRRLLETTSLARLESLVPENVHDECSWAGLIRHGKPYREVLAVATACGADLIVMGVHGRNVVDLALFGSTTNQVVRSATCPVLTVRARP
jgi:nucleotide-binding universal stress UspA family protein